MTFLLLRCVLCQHHTAFRIVHYILHCHSDFCQLGFKFFFKELFLVFRVFLFAESLAFIVNMNEKLSSKLSPGSCFNRFICSKKSAWCSPVDRTTVLLWLAIGCYCPAYLVLLASVSLLHNSRSPCEYLHNSCSRSEGDWKSEKCASGISQEEMVQELKNQSH